MYTSLCVVVAHWSLANAFPADVQPVLTASDQVSSASSAVEPLSGKTRLVVGIFSFFIVLFLSGFYIICTSMRSRTPRTNQQSPKRPTGGPKQFTGDQPTDAATSTASYAPSHNEHQMSTRRILLSHGTPSDVSLTPLSRAMLQGSSRATRTAMMHPTYHANDSSDSTRNGSDSNLSTLVATSPGPSSSHLPLGSTSDVEPRNNQFESRSPNTIFRP